jgi:hypothetical protein
MTGNSSNASNNASGNAVRSMTARRRGVCFNPVAALAPELKGMRPGIGATIDRV